MTSWPEEWLVEHRKVSDYLLNVDHRDGGAKAKAFIKFGFRASEPHELAFALRNHVNQTSYREIPGRYGTRFVFEGPLAAPMGVMPRCRSVWLLKPGETVGRLVTAYPFDEHRSA